MSGRHLETIEHTQEYVLAEGDYQAIQDFEFRLANNLWVMRDAIDWVNDASQSKTLQGNIANFERYFQTRAQAIADVLPKLSVSDNADMRAMAQPLQQVHEQLVAMTQSFRTFLSHPSAETASVLKQTTTTICAEIRKYSQMIGDNPAYRAYRAKAPEEQRVTIDFEIEYDDAA